MSKKDTTLIRVSSNSYNLVLDNKVVEVTRFIGIESLMLHLVMNKDLDEGQYRPKPVRYIGIQVPEE